MAERTGRRSARDIWNPWHGCRRVSEGCDNRYMHYMDFHRGIDASEIKRSETNSGYPLQRRDRPIEWGFAIPSAYRYPKASLATTALPLVQAVRRPVDLQRARKMRAFMSLLICFIKNHY